MTVTLILEIMQLAMGLLGATIGNTPEQLEIAEQLALIAKKAAQAYEAEVGQPLDLSKLTHEDPIL